MVGEVGCELKNEGECTGAGDFPKQLVTFSAGFPIDFASRKSAKVTNSDHVSVGRYNCYR